MQADSGFYCGGRFGCGQLIPIARSRRLGSTDSALAVRLLNVSLSDVAIHYFEAHVFLLEAVRKVATAFEVEPQRVIPLQLRPDDRAPTTCTIWTFTIRGISAHDLLGQMREMFERSHEAFGQWHFGSRKVFVEPLILGSAGVVNDANVQSLYTAWQRPGVGAEWVHDPELWLQLEHVDLLQELRTDVRRFESRMLGLRSAVASSLTVDNPKALQVAKYSQTPLGTVIEFTPATPDEHLHMEQLRKWLVAFETKQMASEIPQLAQDFPTIRSSKTGRPLRLSLVNPLASDRTSTSGLFRAVKTPATAIYENPKGAVLADELPSPETNRPVALGVVIALVLLALFAALCALCVYRLRRNRKAASTPHGHGCKPQKARRLFASLLASRHAASGNRKPPACDRGNPSRKNVPDPASRENAFAK